jgi:hypothetical protein
MKKAIFILLILTFFILFFGCTELSNCGDEICSKEERAQGLCENDCNTPPTINNCDFDGDGKVSEKEADKCGQTKPPYCLEKNQRSTNSDCYCNKDETKKTYPTDEKGKEVLTYGCEPKDSSCTNECGNGSCEHIVCKTLPCPCLETIKSCPQDCTNEPPPSSKEFCGDGICNEFRDACPLDCNHFETPNLCGTEIPYSPVINSVNLESNEPTYVTNYSEGDIWRITQAKDGTIYTAWGDGGGFSNNPFTIPHDIKTHPNFYYLGIGKLTGTFPNKLIGENLYVGDTWVGPSDDKPYSLLAIEDTLYLTACKINDDAFCYLGYSTDGGNKFTMNKKNKIPNFEFINMGQNYGLNTDGYVYVSTLGIGNNIRGALYLGRVPAKQILDVSAYEYYSNENPNSPTWSKDSSDARPILTSGGVYNVMNGITYHSGTDRFILMTEVNVYDAPNPWGPWTCAGTWMTPETSQKWQGGYYPYVIPIETTNNSFYFTLAGQGDTQGDYQKYRFNLGKIIMEIN